MGEKTMDLTGLAMEWEREDKIRDHLRQEGATLFGEDNPESVKCCASEPANTILKIILVRMAAVTSHPQPGVTDLRSEIEKLYKRCGANVDDKTIHDDGWMIRKMCCFVKMKTRKLKVSTAPCLCLNKGLFKTFGG